MKHYPKLKIRELIIDIITEKGRIVPYDLVRLVGMNSETAQRHLCIFEIETGLIKSFKRIKYEGDRSGRYWKFTNKELSAD